MYVERSETRNVATVATSSRVLPQASSLRMRVTLSSAPAFAQERALSDAEMLKLHQAADVGSIQP